MPLQAVLKSLEGLHDELKKHYVQKGEEYHLDLEGGLVPKAKLEEFRDNNHTLENKLKDLEKKFEGLDPEKYRELVKIEEQLRAKKLVDAGKIDELVAERVKELKAEHEKKEKELTGKNETLTRSLEVEKIDNGIMAAATKAGVRDTAIPDVLNRLRSVFKLVDGKVQPVGPDGKTIWGKDGVTPQTMEEAIAGLSTTAAHLFTPSNGTGAGGSGGVKNGVRQVSRAEYDKMSPTDQAKVAKDREHYAIVN